MSKNLETAETLTNSEAESLLEEYHEWKNEKISFPADLESSEAMLKRIKQINADRAESRNEENMSDKTTIEEVKQHLLKKILEFPADAQAAANAYKQLCEAESVEQYVLEQKTRNTNNQNDSAAGLKA